MPGAAHHDGAAHPRGEPVRARPGAQGWGGHLKPYGVWIPLGAPSPLPLELQITPQEAPRPPYFPQIAHQGAFSPFQQADSPPEMQTQPKHVQITPQGTPDPSQGARSTSRSSYNTPVASSIPQRVLNIIQRGLDAP